MRTFGNVCHKVHFKNDTNDKDILNFEQNICTLNSKYKINRTYKNNALQYEK